MSAIIKVDKFQKTGELVISSENLEVCPEEFAGRVEALLTAIQTVPEHAREGSIYYLAEILREYMPTPQQWEQILIEKR